MKKKYYLFVFTLLFSFQTINCQTHKHSVKGGVNSNIQSIYQKAIANAACPEPKEIDSNLVAITDNNPNLIWKIINNEKYLLVVAWKQDASYYKKSLDTIYNTGTRPIWITTAPELKNRFKKLHPTDTVSAKPIIGINAKFYI